MQDLDFMWNGGETRRYHGFRMLMEDTVGHHSYNVCCIIIKVRPAASATLLRAALKHDMAEHLVGDMPAPSKRAMPDYMMVRTYSGAVAEEVSFREVFAEYEDKMGREHGVVLDEGLSPEEAWVLKFADAIDGMRFCLNELLLGNRTPRLRTCYETSAGYVASLLWVDFMDNPIDMLLTDVTSPHAQACDKELYMTLRERWARTLEGRMF